MVAVTAPVPALQRARLHNQVFEAVAVYRLLWLEQTTSPAAGRRTAEARGLTREVFGHDVAHVPTDGFARAAAAGPPCADWRT